MIHTTYFSHSPIDCFEEFGYDVVSSIIEAESSGYVTMNKFWPFENYNYLVYSKTSNSNPAHVESAYLSTGGYLLEVLLGIFMVIIALGRKHVCALLYIHIRTHYGIVYLSSDLLQ